MRQTTVIMMAAWAWIGPEGAVGQMVMTGRITTPRVAGSDEVVPQTAVRCFASLPGSTSQSLGFRTWETKPAGWYRLAGNAGNYTLVCSSPAHFMRPVVLTNLFTFRGDKVERPIRPRFDFAVFDESRWDTQPARAYYQTFVARGTSVTHVGFRLASDGVDGFGPGKQNLVVSVHRRGEGTPETWPRIGPAMAVIDVDSGGGKNYVWSAGWNSGEVVTIPGETYAVRIGAETPAGTFQPFWHPDADREQGDCYRVGEGNTGFQSHDLWMAIGSDGDGLVIPYNKRVHKKYFELAGFTRKWSQTYVARGRGLASVILYAAVHGTQPPLARQRVRVRVRRGGPDGPGVGLEKIAAGNGNYTGDASWGTFGLAFAPGEIPLEPGVTYAIEFESIENYHTLHGFVNIKGQVSNEKVGFNPYRKHPPDDYSEGVAYRDGRTVAEHDLDMQIIEYAFEADRWSLAVETKNLLANGDMQAGPLDAEELTEGRPDAWTTFSLDPGTTFAYQTDAPDSDNRVARVLGGSLTGKTVDGGYVQRIDGLQRYETYRLSGRLRSSWPVDVEHQCLIGYDPTGQTNDPRAETITWTVLPDLHGLFIPHTSEPIRPAQDAISVWLRARTTSKTDAPFKADFDDVALRRVRTSAPPGG